MWDVLIRRGKIIDGSGQEGYIADLAIEQDKIVAIGNLSEATAKEEINADGKIVCPGFVDPHSHADMSLHKENAEELLQPLIQQGITTFVGGNCGVGLSPIFEERKDSILTYIGVFSSFDSEKEFQWRTTAEYLDFIETKKIPLNSAILIPHGLLRLHGVGIENRYATDDEIQTMVRDLDVCMDAGGIGMSTGLQYYPGNQTDTRELVELGKVLKKHNGVFTSHLRSYSSTTLNNAIDEVITVAETNQIRAQVSHLFWVPDFGIWGPFVRSVIRTMASLSKWITIPIPLGKPIEQAIERIISPKSRDVHIGVDVMPTTTGFTHLLAFFPPWSLLGDRAEVINRLKDKETRKKILHSIEYGKMEWPHTGPDSWSLNLFRLMGWECVTIMTVKSEKNKRYEGMNLVDIARERNVHPFDAACDLLLEEDGNVFVFESMAEPDDLFTERSTFPSMSHPEVMISTDAILMGLGKPSPLFYGCYPKYLQRYCKKMKLVDIETAIRKCTSLAAEHFQIQNRGLLKKGYFADVLVIDMESIGSKACFKSPTEPPTGIEEVIINGKRVVKGGNFQKGLNAGHLLRHKN